MPCGGMQDNAKLTEVVQLGVQEHVIYYMSMQKKVECFQPQHTLMYLSLVSCFPC